MPKRAEIISRIEKAAKAAELKFMLLREGANHTIYENPAAGLWSTIPRHREVKEWLVRKICKDLSIPAPR